jgi:hypothetical protein
MDARARRRTAAARDFREESPEEDVEDVDQLPLQDRDEAIIHFLNRSPRPRASSQSTLSNSPRFPTLAQRRNG